MSDTKIAVGVVGLFVLLCVVPFACGCGSTTQAQSTTPDEVQEKQVQEDATPAQPPEESEEVGELTTEEQLALDAMRQGHQKQKQDLQNLNHSTLMMLYKSRMKLVVLAGIFEGVEKEERALLQHARVNQKLVQALAEVNGVYTQYEKKFVAALENEDVKTAYAYGKKMDEMAAAFISLRNKTKQFYVFHTKTLLSGCGENHKCKTRLNKCDEIINEDTALKEGIGCYVSGFMFLKERDETSSVQGSIEI